MKECKLTVCTNIPCAYYFLHGLSELVLQGLMFLPQLLPLRIHINVIDVFLIYHLSVLLGNESVPIVMDDLRQHFIPCHVDSINLQFLQHLFELRYFLLVLLQKLLFRGQGKRIRRGR